MQMSGSQGLDALELVLVALYGYDAGDRRLIRFVAGEATYLSVYDGWQEIEELIPVVNGALVENRPYRQFVWGERLNELVSFLRFDGVGWHEYFVSSGGQDSVFRLYDSQGAVVEATDYDDYGRAKVYTNVAYDQSGNWVGGAYHGPYSLVGNPYQWKGHRADPETGLVYMRHRYYSTSRGRFITQDPIGVWGDWLGLGNGYSYAANAPQVYCDIMGLQVVLSLLRPGNVFIHRGPAPDFVPLGSDGWGAADYTFYPPTDNRPEFPNGRLEIENVYIILPKSDGKPRSKIVALYFHELMHSFGRVVCMDFCMNALVDPHKKGSALKCDVFCRRWFGVGGHSWIVPAQEFLERCLRYLE